MCCLWRVHSCQKCFSLSPTEPGPSWCPPSRTSRCQMRNPQIPNWFHWLQRGGGAELKTQFCKQKSKITAAPGQTPGVTAMSSTAMKPLLLVSASMSSWTLKIRGEWLMRYYLSLSLRHIHHTWKGLVVFTDWENPTQLLPLLELWNTSWLSDGPEWRYTLNVPESLSRNQEMSISPPVIC